MKMRIARVRVFEDTLSLCEKFYIRRVAGKTNILLYIDVAMLLYIYRRYFRSIRVNFYLIYPLKSITIQYAYI